MQNRRKITLNVFSLCSGEILCSSKKDDILVLSSPKMEYMAATSTSCQGLMLR